MPDREKVIKGLEVCTSTADGESCPKDCPYYQEVCYGYDQLMRDALALLKEQKEQKFFVDKSGKITPLPVVVRCKDCKHWSAERINDYNKCKRWINVGVKNFATMGDWFCADGEHK